MLFRSCAHVTMNSFKVYLPSNACRDVFPQNNPTDYSIRFDDPIYLNGKWEVGVESIAYSSHINDKKEHADIFISLDAEKSVPKNDVHPFKFITTEKGEWKGCEGVLPSSFERDTTEIQSIIDSLNYMSFEILKPQFQHRIFTFSLNDDDRVVYKCYDDNFALRLTPRLARVLGFRYKTIFIASKTVIAGKPEAQKKLLEKEDYLLRYCNVVLQEETHRLMIKAKGERFDGKTETVLALWKKAVSDVVDIRPEFKGNKLVLHNHRSDIAVVFSEDLFKAFHLPQVLISSTSQWASSNAELKKDHTNSEWSMKVFSTKMIETSVAFSTDLTLRIYPWRSKNVKKLLYFINTQVKSALQEELKKSYDSKRHYFNLSLEPSEHCKLALGTDVNAYFSKNLSYLLGLPDNEIRARECIGGRKVEDIDKHSRQLHLLSNVIQPTAYGKNQRNIRKVE